MHRERRGMDRLQVEGRQLECWHVGTYYKIFSTHKCLPGCRPAVCSCTRNCQPQCSSERLPGDWTRQSFPLPPLEKRNENKERERVRKKSSAGERDRRVKENSES